MILAGKREYFHASLILANLYIQYNTSLLIKKKYNEQYTYKYRGGNIEGIAGKIPNK